MATVKFRHPVDAEQFEPRVSLAVAKDAEYLGLTPDSRHFTVAYDKFNGAKLNYDGFGRRASDNNVLYLMGWLAF